MECEYNVNELTPKILLMVDTDGNTLIYPITVDDAVVLTEVEEQPITLKNYINNLKDLYNKEPIQLYDRTDLNYDGKAYRALDGILLEKKVDQFYKKFTAISDSLESYISLSTDIVDNMVKIKDIDRRVNTLKTNYNSLKETVNNLKYQLYILLFKVTHLDVIPDYPVLSILDSNLNIEGGWDISYTLNPNLENHIWIASTIVTISNNRIIDDIIWNISPFMTNTGSGSYYYNFDNKLYKLSNTKNGIDKPDDNYLAHEWSIIPKEVSPEKPYQYVSIFYKKDDEDGEWSTPVIWNKWVQDTLLNGKEEIYCISETKVTNWNGVENPSSWTNNTNFLNDHYINSSLWATTPQDLEDNNTYYCYISIRLKLYNINSGTYEWGGYSEPILYNIVKPQGSLLDDLDLSNYYTKDEINTRLSNYFTKDQTYSKDQVANNYYNITLIDLIKENYYSINLLKDNYYDKQYLLSNYYDINLLLLHYYTKLEINSKFEELQLNLGGNSGNDDPLNPSDNVEQLQSEVNLLRSLVEALLLIVNTDSPLLFGSGTFKQAFNKSNEVVDGVSNRTKIFPWLLIDVDDDNDVVRKLIYHVGNSQFIDALGSDIIGELDGLSILVDKDCIIKTKHGSNAQVNVLLYKGLNNIPTFVSGDKIDWNSNSEHIIAIDFDNIASAIGSSNYDLRLNLSLLLSVKRLTLRTKDCAQMFKDSPVINVDLSTSKNTELTLANFSEAFSNCENLEVVDLSKVYAKPANTAQMFLYCRAKVYDLRHFDMRSINSNGSEYQCSGMFSYSNLHTLIVGDKFILPNNNPSLLKLNWWAEVRDPLTLIIVHTDDTINNLSLDSKGYVPWMRSTGTFRTNQLMFKTIKLPEGFEDEYIQKWHLPSSSEVNYITYTLGEY